MASEQLQPLSSIRKMEDMEKEGGEESQARQDYRAGRKALDKDDYTMAVISFHNALKGFEEEGDLAGVANASDRIGDCCMKREDFTTALVHFSRALEICVDNDDSFSEAALHKKMAACYRQLGDYDKTLELMFDLTKHYQLLNDPKGTVEVLIVIAETYVEMGEKGKAADTYRTVASIHANFKHSKIAAAFEKRAADLAAD